LFLLPFSVSWLRWKIPMKSSFDYQAKCSRSKSTYLVLLLLFHFLFLFGHSISFLFVSKFCPYFGRLFQFFYFPIWKEYLFLIFLWVVWCVSICGENLKCWVQTFFCTCSPTGHFVVLVRNRMLAVICLIKFDKSVYWLYALSMWYFFLR